MCTFIYNLLFFFSINKNKKKISKRNLTSEEAVANILRFVEADDDNNYFESDCEDELGLAGDDLDEIYDDDRNAGGEDMVMMMRMRLKIKVLLTMTSLSLNFNRAIDHHEKC